MKIDEIFIIYQILDNKNYYICSFSTSEEAFHYIDHIKNKKLIEHGRYIIKKKNLETSSDELYVSF